MGPSTCISAPGLVDVGAMTRFRTALTLACALITVPMLGACGSDEPAKVTIVPSPTPTAVTLAGVITGPFAGHFRSSYPDLGKDATDGFLAEAAMDTCENLAPKPVSETASSRKSVVAKTQRSFTIQREEPDAKAAVNILNLVVKDVCPARSDDLKKLLG